MLRHRILLILAIGTGLLAMALIWTASERDRLIVERVSDLATRGQSAVWQERASVEARDLGALAGEIAAPNNPTTSPFSRFAAKLSEGKLAQTRPFAGRGSCRYREAALSADPQTAGLSSTYSPPRDRGWIVAGSCLAITTVLWAYARFFGEPLPDFLPWLALSQITILWSVTLMAIAMIAVVRASALEPLFGDLDSAVRFHRIVGPAAVVC